MAGIDSLINSRADAFMGNPQGLMQRYAMNQDLLDLLALQKLKKDKEAAQRDLQMKMQMPPGTVRDQLTGELVDMNKQEIAQALSPGIQQQGERMAAQQLQQAMAAGLPTQPAPNMLGMAKGGIVGYQDGGDVEGEDDEESLLPFEINQRKYARGKGGLDVDLPNPMEVGSDIIDWAAENPLDALTAALLVHPASRAVGMGARGLATVGGKVGPPIAKTLSKFFTKPNPNVIQGKGFTMRPPGAPDRVFSPTRTGLTGAAAAQGIGALLGGDEDGSPDDVLEIPITRGQPVEEPSAPSVDDVDSIDDTADYIRSLTSEDSGPIATEQPDIIARSKRRLEQLEEEERSKLGAIIAFLQGAGASGGTNLGATMTGGSAGLNARNQQIKQEMADIIKNIESLQMQQAQMDRQAFESDREYDEGVRQFDARMKLEDRKLEATIEKALQDAQNKGSLTPANRIAVERMAREYFEQPLAMDKVLREFNQARNAQGLGVVEMKDLTKNPNLQTAYDAFFEQKVIEKVKEISNRVAGGGGDGFIYLGQE